MTGARPAGVRADPPHDSPDAPFLCFDSLDTGRDARSFSFHDFRGEVVAHALDDVRPALREVGRVVAHGLHAAGFIAYEAAPAFEPRFACRPPRAGLPLLWFGLFDERREAARPHAFDARDDAHDAMDACDVGSLLPSVTEPEFLAAAARIRAYILAGDTYQVNYTFRLRAAFRGSAAALYRRLCRAQRAGWCAHLRLPRFSILSASPELFFRWSGGELELRPMKGTRRRGRWAEEDDVLAADLAGSAKERAENLMIVDLLRNDAGRVAEFGSVHVPELFRVERYPTVHQMTSTVRARTRPDVTLEDVLRALFPSGSVTGAPKLRTSEIIAELEDSPRGVYTGAIGCVSPGGAAFSVAIRTLVLDRDTGELELGVGAGITADSRAEAEHEECLAKAAFVRASSPPFRLLESLRHDAEDGCFLLDEHLARLSGSARYFGFRFDAARARERLLAHADGLRGGVHKVRLLVDRSGAMEVESEPIAADAGPARVALAPEPVDERDVFLYHKTTWREVYRARKAARPDCDDVILVNRRGELADATTANLVIELDGELCTPPVNAGLLPGVFRAHLLARGELRERRLVPADLHRAERVFLINSVRQWREAVLVE